MIAKPVKVESASDAFYIVDANGQVIADCITRKEWADFIASLINGEIE